MRCWAAPPRGAPPPLRGSQPCPAFYESDGLTVCAACNSFRDWVHHTHTEAIHEQRIRSAAASLDSSGSYSQQLASTRHGSTLHTRVVQISRSCCRAIRRRQSRRDAVISVSAGACCGERNRGVTGAARTRTRGHGTSVCRRRVASCVVVDARSECDVPAPHRWHGRTDDARALGALPAWRMRACSIAGRMHTRSACSHGWEKLAGVALILAHTRPPHPSCTPLLFCRTPSQTRKRESQLTAAPARAGGPR